VKPPMPWIAKPSTASSIRRRTLSPVAKLATMAVTKPIASDDGVPTKPAAGVMPTRPATMPEQSETADHLRV